MKKNVLLLITSLTSVCAIVGTVFAVNSGVNKSAAYAEQRPSSNPYVMNITNFTENGYSTEHFVAKTETGYGINFRNNHNNGFFKITADEIGVRAGSMIFNDISTGGGYGGMNNAINQMTSITVTFNEGGQLYIDAYWCPEPADYYPYIESADLTSGVAYNFTEGGNLPNVIDINAVEDTIITSIRIEYLCH